MATPRFSRVNGRRGLGPCWLSRRSDRSRSPRSSSPACSRSRARTSSARRRDLRVLPAWFAGARTTPRDVSRGRRAAQCLVVAQQCSLELDAGTDVELAEDLVQVILDRTRADEQLSANLRVREPVTGEPRDLCFLGGQVVAGVGGSLAGMLARGLKLARGAPGERLDAHLREHLLGGAQLLACIHAPFLAAQPFAVEEVGARELRADPGASQPLDRLPVEALGGVVVAQQRA